MRKSLLLFLFACLFLGGASAQRVLTNDVRGNVITNNPIQPGENELWWGYFDGNLKNTYGIGAGNEAVPGITYNSAIFIPGDNPMGQGQTIKAIRLYFASALNMSDIKIWLSKQLPATADAADIEVKNINKSDVTDGSTDGWTTSNDPQNDFAFDTPYTIDADGVYVGYSFKINKINCAQDQLPVTISLVPRITEKNANFFSMDGNWQDLTGQEMGNLALRVLMEGKVQDNAINVNPEFTKDVFGAKNSTVNLPVRLVNMGANGFDRFSYVITVDGVKSEEKEFVLDDKVTDLGGSFSCELPAQLGANSGKSNVVVEITKVNGVENNTPSRFIRDHVTVLTEVATRKVVIEQFTGTWCQLAAKGYAGIGRARAVYGDDVVCSNIHWGGTDPMYCPDYKAILPQTSPLCDVSRVYKGADSWFGNQTDDVFGLGLLIDELRKNAPVAKIKAEGVMSADAKTVTASSHTTFLYTSEENDAQNYTVAYVLQANGLKGDGAEWIQKNVFGEFKGDEDDFAYEPIFVDWIGMDKEITDFVYDDVPVATKGLKDGVDGSIQYPFVENEEQKYSIEFDLDKIGNRIQDKDQLYVCVYLIDKRDGSIINADYQKVVNDEDAAIEDVENADNTIVKRYALDGTELVAPVKGINIVKYADGRIEKVLVK